MAVDLVDEGCGEGGGGEGGGDGGDEGVEEFGGGGGGLGYEWEGGRRRHDGRCVRYWEIGRNVREKEQWGLLDACLPVRI